MAGRILTSELEHLFSPSGQVIHQVVLVLPSPHARLSAGAVHTITGHLSFKSSLIGSGHIKVPKCCRTKVKNKIKVSV